MNSGILSLEEQAEIAARELLARRAAKSTMKGFVEYQYPNFICAPHHQLMLDKIEDIMAGRTNRLIIEVPPRYGKTLLISQHLSPYYIGHHPDRFVIMASYEQELALISGRYVRNLVGGQKFQNIFPGVDVVADSKAAGRWNTPQGGGYFAVGIGGGDGSGLTGRGGHLAIIDDPIKGRLNADSATIREGIKSWYQSTLLTRLMNDNAVILCLTRWHHDDLAGWILANSKKGEWDVVRLPALAEENDPLGRAKGEALWPWRHTREQLIELRNDPTKVGVREFESLYQQNPTVQEGNIFKMDKWRRWDEKNIPPQWDLEVISMDTNVSEGKDNDYTVIQHWGKAGGFFYLLDQVKGVWGMSQQLSAFRIFCDARPWVAAKLIEKKANGAAIINLLSAHVAGLIPVEPIGSKEQRALAIEPYVIAGNVFIPEQRIAPWVEEFVLEAAQFPHGRHDDQVDTMTQALNWLAQYGRQMSDVNSALAWAFGGGN